MQRFLREDCGGVLLYTGSTSSNYRTSADYLPAGVSDYPIDASTKPSHGSPDEYQWIFSVSHLIGTLSFISRIGHRLAPCRASRNG